MFLDFPFPSMNFHVLDEVTQLAKVDSVGNAFDLAVLEDLVIEDGFRDVFLSLQGPQTEFFVLHHLVQRDSEFCKKCNFKTCHGKCRTKWCGKFEWDSRS